VHGPTKQDDVAMRVAKTSIWGVIVCIIVGDALKSMHACDEPVPWERYGG
jgi:hypothetical protein